MENKSKKSCFIQGCIATLVVCALLIITGLATGYYFLYHTPTPANLIKKVLESSDPNLNIGEISGGLSSGFTVDKIQYTHDDGNISVVKDIGFSYENRGDVTVIKSIHVKHAHLYMDLSTKPSTGDDSKDDSLDDPYASEDSDETWNMLLERIDILDITIEDPKTGDMIKVEEITLDGLDLRNNQFKIGEARIKSQNLSFEINPTGTLDEDGRSPKFTYKGAVKKELSKDILQDFSFKGEVNLEGYDLSDKDDLAKSASLTALGGKFTYQTPKEGKRLFQVRSLTFDDYFKNCSPMSDLNFTYHSTINGKQEKVIAQGNFKIGKHLFKIKKQEKLIKRNAEPQFSAECHKKGVVYTYISTSDDKYILKSSNPKESSEAILIKLLYNKKKNKLTKLEKEKIKDYMESMK
ncbi:MAG: hypothetical protein HRT89_07170 [Lentisphaeria bacterium]|nr:hypothetical protein [Lentisphaeria bacterium]NQZ67834.1 hypothetical protein [Lentisphaeria bacterium]